MDCAEAMVSKPLTLLSVASDAGSSFSPGNRSESVFRYSRLVSRKSGDGAVSREASSHATGTPVVGSMGVLVEPAVLLAEPPAPPPAVAPDVGPAAPSPPMLPVQPRPLRVSANARLGSCW